MIGTTNGFIKSSTVRSIFIRTIHLLVTYNQAVSINTKKGDISQLSNPKFLFMFVLLSIEKPSTTTCFPWMSMPIVINISA